MKKITLLLVITFIITINSFAQTNGTKGYLAVGLGVCAPVEEFASKDVKSSTSGLATSGALFDLSFAYRFGKHFGMSALIRGQANAIDDQKILDASLESYPGVSGSITSTSWSLSSYMIGGYSTFPISDKVSFESRVMIGLSAAKSPELLINLNGLGWVKQESVSSSSISYLIGAGFKFDAGKHFCVLANLDYLATKPEFAGVKTTSSTGSTTSSTNKQSMKTVNINVGFGYKFK